MSASDFIRDGYKHFLELLTPEHTALWGVMSPQHMVEHLSLTTCISNGKLSAPILVDEATAVRRRSFLHSDEPFKKGIVLGGGDPTLQPLKFGSLEEAKERLDAELARFQFFFDTNPNAQPIHPVFGALPKSEWELFHSKHMKHHFSQFGIF